MTFINILLALANGVITIEGVEAELTRQVYYDRYVNWMNTGQYVPTVNYNTQNQEMSIYNTQYLSILSTDILSANDWICINANLLTSN